MEIDARKPDYNFSASGELSRFAYLLLGKNKPSHSLPFIEKWEAYKLPNRSTFPQIEDEDFLEGTQMLPALEEVSSCYLNLEFRKRIPSVSGRPCSEIFILSTVAAWFLIGQGLSCFCSEIIHGGGNYFECYLFRQLLDGPLWKGGSRDPLQSQPRHISILSWESRVSRNSNP